MDEEAARLIQLQSEMEQQIIKSTSSPGGQVSGGGGGGGGGAFGAGSSAPFGNASSSMPMSAEDRLEADLRSIYVGNVDYSATAQGLEAHFHGCGSINRVTILCDKFSGHPKGFAYVEFGDKDSVQTAQALDDSLFKGRQIKVTPKRTNRPGISTTDRVPRGGGRGASLMMQQQQQQQQQQLAFGFGRGGRGGMGAQVGGGGYMGSYPMLGAGRGGVGAGPAGFNPYMRSMRGRVVK
jgi:polyadenylate-binding protein 2